MMFLSTVLQPQNEIIFTRVCEKEMTRKSTLVNVIFFFIRMEEDKDNTIPQFLV